jgi:hypothetical protein
LTYCFEATSKSRDRSRPVFMFLVSYVIGTDVHERVVGVRRVFKENIKGFSMKWRIIRYWILFFYYYIFVKFKIDFLYIIKFRRHDFWNNRVPGSTNQRAGSVDQHS